MLPFKTVSKGLITTNEDRSLVYYFKRKKSIVVKKKIVFKLMQHRPQVHSNVSIKFIFGSNCLSFFETIDVNTCHVTN
jgi:hypothetical protein